MDDVRRCGLVIAMDGDKLVVLWTRENGDAFICADDTFRLQELVDQDDTTISNDEFYVSDTIWLSKSITIHSCKFNMIGAKDKPIFTLLTNAKMVVIESNYFSYCDAVP